MSRHQPLNARLYIPVQSVFPVRVQFCGQIGVILKVIERVNSTDSFNVATGIPYAKSGAAYWSGSLLKNILKGAIKAALSAN